MLEVYYYLLLLLINYILLMIFFHYYSYFLMFILFSTVSVYVYADICMTTKHEQICVKPSPSFTNMLD
jgi:hypothetical protein